MMPLPPPLEMTLEDVFSHVHVDAESTSWRKRRNRMSNRRENHGSTCPVGNRIGGSLRDSPHALGPRPRRWKLDVEVPVRLTIVPTMHQRLPGSCAHFDRGVRTGLLLEDTEIGQSEFLRHDQSLLEGFDEGLNRVDRGSGLADPNIRPLSGELVSACCSRI
jgi:hypothetical protein